MWNVVHFLRPGKSRVGGTRGPITHQLGTTAIPPSRTLGAVIFCFRSWKNVTDKLPHSGFGRCNVPHKWDSENSRKITVLEAPCSKKGKEKAQGFCTRRSVLNHKGAEQENAPAADSGTSRIDKNKANKSATSIPDYFFAPYLN